MFHLILIKLCLIWLPNKQPIFIIQRMLKVHVNIQGVNTEVWVGARYEVILEMVWLKHVDAWIACKEITLY